MSNVVDLFAKKAEKHTPEQRLKLFCITEMMGAETAALILTKMSIDKAFAFLAQQAETWDRIKSDGTLNE